MIRNDFAIFILSHGRANNVLTINTLKSQNYTGKYYIIIDDEDDQKENYIKNYGKDNIIIFHKKIISKYFDCMDNFNNNKTPTWARNATFKIAKYLNLKYFLILEDDYLAFNFRYEDGDKLKSIKINNLDDIINIVLKYFMNNNIKSICFAQGGDFIGGKGSQVWKKKLSRKAMNSFFCKTDNPITFLGTFNDDVNFYTDNGKKGDIIFTISNISLIQPTTQKQKGGVTEAYKEFGTYVKSFYSVILNPSFVHIHTMGCGHKRIHHLVHWENCCPKIISDKFRKE